MNFLDFQERMDVNSLLGCIPTELCNTLIWHVVPATNIFARNLKETIYHNLMQQKSGGRVPGMTSHPIYGSEGTVFKAATETT